MPKINTVLLVEVSRFTPEISGAPSSFSGAHVSSLLRRRAYIKYNLCVIFSGFSEQPGLVLFRLSAKTKEHQDTVTLKLRCSSGEE